MTFTAIPHITTLLMGGDEIKDILNKNIFYFSTVYGKLFRSDIIKQKGIKFDKNMNYAEDTVFVFSYLLHINSIHTITSAIGYHYENSEDSLTKQTRTSQQGVYIFSQLCERLLDLKKAYNININTYTAYAGENIFLSVIEGIRQKSNNIFKAQKALQKMCNNKYVIEYFLDNNQIFKGRKRALFNFLAKKKMYNILSIYVLLYRGQIY